MVSTENLYQRPHIQRDNKKMSKCILKTSYMLKYFFKMVAKISIEKK